MTGVAGSNRTIVGLKPNTSPIKFSLVNGSNRTIVGLKQSQERLSATLSAMQQSHHCGIETRAKGLPAGLGQLAAIAPLWD